MAVTNPRKAAIIEKHRKSESDTGSAPVQIAVLTDRIVHLTEHLKTFSKDHATRRGLLRLVGRRSALLRYQAKKNPSAYRELIKELGIRR
ncbi:MAG: 30S ribosomal protein S15 [Planctomycetota bacterium]|nr:30S ribosomal protein S15 [Planctomycetota bacterium]